MDYLALYRKYRPKELDEVVGQSEIKQILASSVKNGTITHAYLFSGPRGTGKTTMAKILAKMVNCEQPTDGNACGKCDSCKNVLNSNDVIEIDAASNNGVDEIRDLREKANLVPTSAKYKVYIIDEVHMLTTQAFNALLKTLEEPPKHVIFVLATTEYYKIPLTITSRCQKFQFNKINDKDIVARLTEIAKNEKIKIDDDALLEIAKISDGGMRDSINFLDQLRSFTSKKITIQDVYNVCGNVSVQEMVDILTAIKNSDAEKITIFFENMSINGKNYAKFFEDLISFLKDIILFKKNVNHKYIKSEIQKVNEISKIYSDNEIFMIVDNINQIMDKLKYVSKQSVIVTSNFLLLMNKVNNINVKDESIFVENAKKQENPNNDKQYDMAFNFTSNEQNDENKFTDNNNKENTDIVNNDNFATNNDNNKNKQIIINNTFAVASKEIKKDLQSKFAKINDYLTDKKFMSAAGTLIDTKIEVAGNGYIILSGNSNAIVDKVYTNYKLCSELLDNIFKNKFNFVVVTNDEWNILRDEYIKNTKNGKKYKLMELEQVLIIENTTDKEPTIVDKLFDLVGEDIVEFK